jgi:hypothetical protein
MKAQATGAEGDEAKAIISLPDRTCVCIKRDTNIALRDRASSFADLVWKPRVLLEMKKRGEKLHLHYQQAFDYWLHAVPNRPRYMVLCNFDQFSIYDFEHQLDEPVDKVDLSDLQSKTAVRE